MGSDPQVRQSEAIEQRAIERDLVTQLCPNKETQSKAKARAERLRKLLNRVKDRNADE